jgi:hypothetical protein
MNNFIAMHPQTTKNGNHPGNLAALYGIPGVETSSRKKMAMSPQEHNISDPSNADLNNL